MPVYHTNFNFYTSTAQNISTCADCKKKCILWKNNYVFTPSPFLVCACLSLSWLLVPDQWERKVCKSHQHWYCHFLSETSCAIQPFAEWLVCLVSVPTHCKWAPCLTTLWCRQSSCFVSVSRSRCDSPCREEGEAKRIGGIEMGGNGRAGGQHGVEFRVNVAMPICLLGGRSGNERRGYSRK